MKYSHSASLCIICEHKNVQSVLAWEPTVQSLLRSPTRQSAGGNGRLRCALLHVLTQNKVCATCRILKLVENLVETIDTMTRWLSSIWLSILCKYRTVTHSPLVNQGGNPSKNAFKDLARLLTFLLIQNRIGCVHWSADLCVGSSPLQILSGGPTHVKFSRNTSAVYLLSVIWLICTRFESTTEESNLNAT